MGALFWAILSGTFAVLEIIIPGLVTIWFALSALIVMFFSNFSNDSTIEFFVFAVLSLIFLIFTRPVLRRYIDMQKKNGFNSSMKGADVKVEKIVDARRIEKEYEVKFKGSIWTGISEEIFSAGEIVKIKTTDLNFKYRTTEIKENKWIVISALFKFGFGFDKEASQDKKNQREVKHPLDLPNLGSTFKNPEGTFAAKLISDADLKGYRVGDVVVSPKHPNFVTNVGNATFNDVISVIEHVKEVVFEKFGVKLETEIIILK